MRPRIALRAVVLLAPFGPISSTIRPSSTRKLTPSRAIVVPNALRRSRASMHAIASALLFLRFRFGGTAGTIQQVFGCKPEALNGGLDPRPFFRQKFLTFALQQ